MMQETDAKKGGRLGFMARVMVIATFPHRKLDKFTFQRRNGFYTLTMLANPNYGLPYGTLPRLIMAWVTTKAVQLKSPVLNLGETQTAFLSQLALSSQGGKRGDITRLKDQMLRLFTTQIACIREDKEQGRIYPDQFLTASSSELWWKPIEISEADRIRTSSITLSNDFFEALIKKPVPVDWGALKNFRRSPLQMDVYVWLTYRMSYLSTETLISWREVKKQFGAHYADNKQGRRDFKKNFLAALRVVLIVYTDANVSAEKEGLRMLPSFPHIKKKKS